MTFYRRALLSLVIGLSAVLVAAPLTPAHAWERNLRSGDKGADVRALQVRLAGWFPGEKFETFVIDGEFGDQTVRAVKAYERFHGLEKDGVAEQDLFKRLDNLKDEDGSTAHFDWSEFEQNENAYCGAKANAYAGTLKGGLVSPRRTKIYVKRLMWRLEALREKAGNHSISINSGFRSVAYNDCIGGARASQHMYGTAADQRQANVPNRRQRWLAKKSQFHGIGCYASQTHNHVDLRIDNRDLPTQQSWWWPDRDQRGLDLDESGRPCWGETTAPVKKVYLASGDVQLAEATRTVVERAVASVIPTEAELEVFEAAGEGLLAEGVD